MTCEGCIGAFQNQECSNNGDKLLNAGAKLSILEHVAARVGWLCTQRTVLNDAVLWSRVLRRKLGQHISALRWVARVGGSADADVTVRQVHVAPRVTEQVARRGRQAGGALV